MQKQHLIAPSLLAADFSRLGDEFAMVSQSQADWLHLDVMDGRFVPNITFGTLIVQAAKAGCSKPLDVHLMILEPERYVEDFRKAGADVITVHYEACTHLHRVLQQIRDTGAQPGIAINPHTPAEALEDILCEADLVCVMSVNPGFGGQKFIYRTIPKVRRLRQMIDEQNLATRIEIDGGVGLQNAEALLQAGADVLVAGSSVFGAEDPMEAIRRLKAIGKEAEAFGQ